MEEKPTSFFRNLKRRLKKGITPTVSPHRSPLAAPSQGLPSESANPETNPSQLNLSPPIDPHAIPRSGQTSTSETGRALLGGLKTLLELGALVSQGLPTQIPKAVLESISYMIKAAEVRTQTF